MELFHTSGLLYEAGDTLHPGSWGRVILGAGSGHNLYFRELLFEEMRLQIAPDKPSRLRCLFGLQTLPELHQYQAMLGRPTHAYRIAVSDDADIHLADLGIFDRVNQPGRPESARAALIDYWQGTPGQVMEALVGADATVLEKF